MASNIDDIPKRVDSANLQSDLAPKTPSKSSNGDESEKEEASFGNFWVRPSASFCAALYRANSLVRGYSLTGPNWII